MSTTTTTTSLHRRFSDLPSPLYLIRIGVSKFMNESFGERNFFYFAIYHGHLTTNILGGSLPIMGPWGHLSPPPIEECFRSKTNKLRPVCSRLVRHQNSCVICKESWKLHEKKMIKKVFKPILLK